jgi:exopolysaccharide/PEP-CTERM locus tyrosine autokinase
LSFVEKALQRLKQQDSEMAPLGEFQSSTEPAPGSSAPEAYNRDIDPASVADTPLPAPRGRLVAVDRLRLREEGFLAPEKYQRRMADEYRRIKRPLIANAFGIGVPALEDGTLVLVSSALAGEGKTHTCLNLALSLSTERDRTVLLVDGDVPKPHISRLLGVAEQPGLLDALGEQPLPLEQLIIRTDIPRLSVLPAGRWSQDATELLSSGRMRALCRELATRYPDRIVLFDSSPLLAATEAQAIAATVGQVVLVIAENMTARSDVAAALSLLDENKAVNAILNKSRHSSGGGYYGGYGYGYGAHAEPEADPNAN